MKKLYKFFDKQTAEMLKQGGFCYVEEKINNGQTVYCFEESEELKEIIQCLLNDGKYQDVIVAVDNTLHF